ncbi:MAG: hypothetical protein PH343_09175 [Nitrospira sp.]|nr:hypothetical protein [Nitrospira sp.]
MKIDKIIGALLFIAGGLWLIFSKNADESDFLYCFDGKNKESKSWRTFKRVVIGLVLLISGGGLLLEGVLNQP